MLPKSTKIAPARPTARSKAKAKTSTLTFETPPSSGSKKPVKLLSQPIFSLPSSQETSREGSVQIENRKGKQRAQSPVDDQLWVDKYEPQTAEDLAVHKRKVEDVRKWLGEAFDSSPGSTKRRKYRRILALTGPAGTGKTVTIRVLAKEMNVQVVEWQNSVDGGAIGDQDFDRESFSSKFQAFLSRATTYSTLTFDSPTTSTAPPTPSLLQPLSNNHIILIEDFPNVAHAGTRDAFHTALRSFLASELSCPLVLVISDAGLRGEVADEAGTAQGRRLRDEVLSIRNVVPPELVQVGLVTEIEFNPVAITLLRRAINSIVEAHFTASNPHLPPSKEAIDMVVQSANGDIRSALMTLQFACIVDLPGSGGAKRGKGGKLSKRAKAEATRGILASITQREQSLVLFHLLGKLLYNKRFGDDPEEKEEWPPELPGSLPPHLAHHERRPSKVDPNALYGDSPIDTSLLSLYLHQNYTQYCDEMDECEAISDWLSIADTFGGTGDLWPHQSTLAPYAFQTLTRGVLHSLPTPVARRNQKIFKPEFFDHLRKTRDAEGVVADVVAWIEGTSGVRWGEDEVSTELGGVLKFVDGAPRSHVAFTHLPYSLNPSRMEQLDEQDAAALGDTAAEERPEGTHGVGQGTGEVQIAEDREREWLSDDDIGEF
ncbi:hypothetical protein BOTBODRAFT_189751 [Botryobasidium botryosum FD-172 SS1]|uniref:AAA+ ATPase domain-containing protein n=1 Tax=Botryobasidium botryosum (strain FD-172 SS1) TaxID=930990 RepID=A0A067M7L2_BOTB1|nr:hypothetical protein BOTBODRAFT_189751 [Botryobasidium botryosum FD-172 SS1]